MRYVLMLFMVVGLMATGLPNAFAQDTADTGQGLKVTFDKNWKTGKPPKGAVLLLKSTSDKRSQVEFRVATQINAKKGERYFASFHTSLQKSGLKKLTRKEAAVYGGKTGAETEYELRSKSNTFRLVVWEHQAGDRAWLVVGFFDLKRREDLYAAYQKILNELAW